MADGETTSIYSLIEGGSLSHRLRDDSEPLLQDVSMPGDCDAGMELPRTEKVKKWKTHVGKNMFFCGGRILISRKYNVFLFSLFILSTTLTVFFVFEGPFLWGISPAIPIVAAVLTTFVLVNFFVTSLSDPGIMPRATIIEQIAYENQAKMELDPSSLENIRIQHRVKDVMINGQRIQTKYCHSCRMYRPPRTTHCSICDNCVNVFDHHCPWVGNCVGIRNYRYFYFFVISLALLVVYVFACSCTHLVYTVTNGKMVLSDAIKATPISVVLMTISFCVFWSVVGLGGFHSYLVFSNLTTNEDVKGTYHQRQRTRQDVAVVEESHDTRNVRVQNPFSKTPWINLKQKLFTSQQPSLLDGSGLTSQEPYVIVPKRFKFHDASLVDSSLFTRH